MVSMYAQLVAKLGEEGARKEMARRRSLAKNSGSFLSNASKAKRQEISLMGVKAREAKRGKGKN